MKSLCLRFSIRDLYSIKNKPLQKFGGVFICKTVITFSVREATCKILG